MQSSIFRIDPNAKLLREEVYNALKNSIIKGDLKPGERLVELKLAESMGVSRTPLREAIHKLKMEGLLSLKKNVGATVAESSLKDVEDLYGLRIVLERYAAKLACINIDSDQLTILKNNIENTGKCISIKDYNEIIELNTAFHDTIVKSSNNYRLFTTLNNLREHIYRYRKAVIWNTEESNKSLEGHIEIYNALKNRNIEQIEFIVEKYIIIAKEAVICRLKDKFC